LFSQRRDDGLGVERRAVVELDALAQREAPRLVVDLLPRGGQARRDGAVLRIAFGQAFDDVLADDAADVGADGVAAVEADRFDRQDDRHHLAGVLGGGGIRRGQGRGQDNGGRNGPDHGPP